MNENITVEVKEKDEGLVLVPDENQDGRVIPSADEPLKFDDRFKNRKARRTFMKLLNSNRVIRTTKIIVNPQTGKKTTKRIVKVIENEPKLRWNLMPKFNKDMSEQYSEACGIVHGWRTPGKLGITKANGSVLAL